MNLGSAIRALRNAKGWTLEQLAEASGVDVGTISALEVRDSTRSKYAPQLARGLGVSVDQLLGIATTTATPPPLPPRDFNDRMAVSDSDWGVLQDVRLVMSEKQLKELRSEAERIRLVAQEQLASVSGTSTEKP